jgi:hypothetical protein
VVDDADFEWLSRWSWQLSGSKGYARRTIKITGGKYRTLYMHRFIMSADNGIEVDHINGDSLDNRRQNLRLVTRKQNAQNICALKSSVGARGVFASGNKFSVRIRLEGKRFYLGTFATCAEAAEVAARWRAINMPFSGDAKGFFGEVG